MEQDKDYMIVQTAQALNIPEKFVHLAGYEGDELTSIFKRAKRSRMFEKAFIGLGASLLSLNLGVGLFMDHGTSKETRQQIFMAAQILVVACFAAAAGDKQTSLRKEIEEKASHAGTGLFQPASPK